MLFYVIIVISKAQSTDRSENMNLISLISKTVYIINFPNTYETTTKPPFQE